MLDARDEPWADEPAGQYVLGETRAVQLLVHFYALRS
jgi:hypothetical protein